MFRFDSRDPVTWQLTSQLINSNADMSSPGWVFESEEWIHLSPLELISKWITKFGESTELSQLKEDLWSRMSIRGKTNTYRVLLKHHLSVSNMRCPSCNLQHPFSAYFH